MNDLVAPDMAVAGLALAAAVLYSAWYEFSNKNRRDAKLLAAVGAVSLIGSTAAFIH